MTNHPNLIANPEILFDQVKEGAVTGLKYTSGTTEVYGPDQWRFSSAQLATATFELYQEATSLLGSECCLTAKTKTAKVSAVHDDFDHIEHAIEGWYLRGLKLGTANAAPLMLSFTAEASIAGTYSCAIMEGHANSQSCTKTYTLAAANTPQRFNLSFPANTSAIWHTKGGFGMKVMWDLGSGADFIAPANDVWQPAAFWKGAGTISLTQNANATLKITEVDVYPGTVARPFYYEPYEQQLFKLQRYFYKTFPQGTPVGTGKGIHGTLTYIGALAGAAGFGGAQLQPPANGTIFTSDAMPQTSDPSLITYNPQNANANWYNLSRGADSGVALGYRPCERGVFIQNAPVVADRASDTYIIHATLNRRLGRF